MIDAKIHGKFISAEIKLDQEDCHEFARKKFAKFMQELVRENLNSEKNFKGIPKKISKNFREDF